MRKFDVAYNPPLPDSGERKKEIEEMSLDELAKHIGEVCAKCHGDYTICDGCRGCREGRLLIDKLKEKPEGKLSGIRKMYGLSPAKKQEVARELFRDALRSEDPVKFLMEKCGIGERRAKNRLAVYKKKYVYDRNKVDTEKGLEKLKLEPKKMVDIAPKKEQTVSDLVNKLVKERRELITEREKIDKRISEIDSALSVIRSAVG